MKTLSQHIILRMASVLGPLLMSAACNSGSSDATPPAGRTVMLGVTTEVLGSVRTDSEKMSTLRIVVLHPDGSVEHNRFVDFGSARQAKTRSLPTCTMRWRPIPPASRVSGRRPATCRSFSTPPGRSP